MFKHLSEQRKMSFKAQHFECCKSFSIAILAKWWWRSKALANWSWRRASKRLAKYRLLWSTKHPGVSHCISKSFKLGFQDVFYRSQWRIRSSRKKLFRRKIVTRTFDKTNIFSNPSASKLQTTLTFSACTLKTSAILKEKFTLLNFQRLLTLLKVRWKALFFAFGGFYYLLNFSSPLKTAQSGPNNTNAYYVAFCGVDTDMIDRRPLSPTSDKINSRYDVPFWPVPWSSSWQGLTVHKKERSILYSFVETTEKGMEQDWASWSARERERERGNLSNYPLYPPPPPPRPSTRACSQV